MNVVVFGTSLDPESRSQLLAREAHEQLRARGRTSRLVDLRTLDLPQCGQEGCYEHPDVVRVRGLARGATHLLFATAVYNYDVGSSAKNLIELLGKHALVGKTVGLLCAASGRGSYVAPMSFANSLMLDFRCWIVPRFVFALSGDFEGGRIVNPAVIERVGRLTVELFERTPPGAPS